MNTTATPSDLESKIRRNILPRVNSSSSSVPTTNIESNECRYNARNSSTNLNIEGNKLNNTGALQSIQRKAWLYVGKVNTNFTKGNEIKFLKENLVGEESIVEEIINNNNNYSKAFKIGIDNSLLDIVSNPDFWPNGVTVRRYRFFRAGGKRQEIHT